MIDNGSLVAFISPLDAVCDLSALPSYMIPSMIHRLDRLPLTLNSKVDKVLTFFSFQIFAFFLFSLFFKKKGETFGRSAAKK